MQWKFAFCSCCAVYCYALSPVASVPLHAWHLLMPSHLHYYLLGRTTWPADHPAPSHCKNANDIWPLPALRTRCCSAEETSEGSSTSECIGPLAQPVDAKAAIALPDSASAHSSASMMAKSAAEALSSPHGIGSWPGGSSQAMNGNGNGTAKHAKHHKVQGGKVHTPQHRASPPG